MLMMLFSTAAVVLGCCSIVYLVLWLLHRIALRHYKKVPGIKPVMVVGNIYRLGRMYSKQLMHHPGVYILQGINGTCHLFRKEGFFVVWMSLFPIVSVIKAELIELILNSNTSLEKSFEYSYLHQWLGRGLLTSTGSKWRTRRKLLTPSFHFRILDDFVPTFNEQSLVLVRKLRELRDADHVDIMPLVVLCTLDMVCETVMGVSIGAQTGENPKYVQAVHNLGDALLERVASPLLWPDFIFRLSRTGRGWNRDLKTLHNFTDKVKRCSYCPTVTRKAPDMRHANDGRY
ncbi:Cytochrome P450 4V2, partial [Araneus ventricosus]